MEFGEFEGEVTTRWLTHTGDDRDMILTQPFSFIQSSGERWEVPEGAKINGASIPSLFWSFGPPFVGNYRRASVVHDFYCDVKSRDCKDTHRIFYEGCRADDVSELKASKMYLAILFGGPKWVIEAPIIKPGTNLESAPIRGQKLHVPPHNKPQDFQKAIEWIEATNPSVGEIEAMAEIYR